MNTTNTTFSKNLHRALVASAVACLGLTNQIVRAADLEPGYAPATKLVQFGDLNVASPGGVKQLYQRITAAANEVCGPTDRQLQSFIHHRVCMQQSIARAVQAADVPQLTAFHAAKTGRQVETTKLAQR